MSKLTKICSLHDTAEILLKLALNTNKSINHVFLILLQKAWIQVRDLSLRILGGSVILGQQCSNTNNKNGVDHENVRPMNEVLDDLIKQFKDHLNNIQDFRKPYEVRCYIYCSIA